jgi:phosphoglycerol transferase MdoB-like AlkP superfamily enzyme
MGNMAAGIALLSLNQGYPSVADKQDAQPRKKPNVLILFSDQHNKKVFGFEGHPDVITPNLDRMAAGSVVFDRAYCPVGILYRESHSQGI